MYDAQAIEAKWSGYWREKKTFDFDRADRERPVFTLDTPPPFTNGMLHMGQIFWVSYIDTVARYKRMRGFNILYPIGWDAHGFATEIAVEKKYGKGLSRQEFYKRCAELSSENIGKMREQMLTLGAVFDQKHEYRTTTDEYMAKVQYSLLAMHDKGMLYRGAHPNEWCTYCDTSISREETEEKEEETKLNYVDFLVEKGDRKDKGIGSIVIATTRPELMHACVALAVNPKDERYRDAIGKYAVVPIYDRKVRIVADDLVEKEFGTGAEMVCTFGDKRDINIYYRNKLDLIEAMDKKGLLLNAGEFTGMPLKDARAAVLDKLKRDGKLVKQESAKHQVKVHDRCGTPVELISSILWFVKLKEHSGMIKDASHSINWVPGDTKQRLDDWANNVEWDWNISRNRVFGTPIPFWYCEQCNDVVAPEARGLKDLPIDPTAKKPPMASCRKCGGKIVGTKDTCDSWIDSSITPLVISGWPEDKELFERAFPTGVRIQGTDIVRTWAFTTIFRSMVLAGDKPFDSIIVHGMILGRDGREMHKRFGNGIMLADLVPKYSVDTVRLWAGLTGTLGKDKAFSDKEIEYAKSLLTKIYNSANFVKGALEKGKVPKEEPHKYLNVFDLWMLNRLNQTVKEVTEAYDGYELHEAIGKAANFYWHEFCDFYLENVKHRVYAEGKEAMHTKEAALYVLRHVLLESLKLFAPAAPFLMEEIHSWFGKKSIFDEPFPSYTDKPSGASYAINGLVFKSGIVEADYELAGALLNDIISSVRKEKAGQRIALNKEIASININVPDEYYTVVEASTDELKQICKAKEVRLNKSKELSVNIQV